MLLRFLTIEKGIEKGLERGRQEGIQLGEQRGIEKGERVAALKIARTMLDNGLDRSTVLKMTGLSEDDLSQLRH
ncbi:Uncharacterised protein [Serratia ficaria]|nr:Uncharacterised protein [Serratia ficaria]